MNNLKQQISEKIKTAMKDKNSNLLNTLRSILTKITETEKLNLNKELSDEQILNVIEKLAKQREETIILFKQGNRKDLVETEQYQLNILKEYLPSKMSEDETKKVIQEAISAGANNIGSLMKELNKYGNLIDKKLASQIAKELI